MSLPIAVLSPRREDRSSIPADAEPRQLWCDPSCPLATPRASEWPRPIAQSTMLAALSTATKGFASAPIPEPGQTCADTSLVGFLHESAAGSAVLEHQQETEK